MTVKNLIMRASTIGDVLKMMPHVHDVDDDTIAYALSTITNGQKLGERLLEMGKITAEQLAEALSLQSQMRSMKSIDDLDAFFKSVREREREVCFEVGARLG